MCSTICMVVLALAIGSGARRLDAQVASSDRAKTVNAKQSLKLNLNRAVFLKGNAIVFRAEPVWPAAFGLAGCFVTYPRDPGNAFDTPLPDMGSSSSSREAYRLASALAVTTTAKPEPTTFQWKPALAQSFAFLMFEHGVTNSARTEHTQTTAGEILERLLRFCAGARWVARRRTS